MLPIKEYITQPKRTVVVLMEHFGRWIPDRTYLKWMYRLRVGQRLDLREPHTFGEKIQWLKLYNRKPEYVQMVDKCAAKDYVAKIIGDEYIIPNLGVWDKLDDIDWEALPDRFVLKTTYGGGNKGVVICKDKTSFDRNKAMAKLKKGLKQDIYLSLREWPYKNVPRRIIAEQYIEPQPNVKDLPDYKWYCFNGEPQYCQVIQDRTTHETIDFFDKEWKHQEFVGLNPAADSAPFPPTKPVHLETQINIARELCKDIPFARIDFYETDSNVYFGEITLYPKSGFGLFRPNHYNDLLGQMIRLPENKR